MSQSIVKQQYFVTSLLQTVVNHFKPHRAEALQRIRVNTFCLLLILILSNLLPVPSLQSAVRAVLSSNRSERWSSDSPYRWFCITVTICTMIFGYNLLEALYAVKYPRSSPLPTPARSKNIFQATPTQKRPFKVLSPNSSPQLQKAFSVSKSASFSGSHSTYPVSPLSTPSRIIHYPSVLVNSTNTHASSTSTMTFSTPSPTISAYRGKHPGSVGRALDQSIMGFIPSPEAENEG